MPASTCPPKQLISDFQNEKQCRVKADDLPSLTCIKGISTSDSMPKEAKKRGRRAERKRKEEAEKGQPGPQVLAQAEEAGHFYSGHDGGEVGGEEDTQFYGLLNGEESEYFRKADEILELNQFGDGDERALFIANVWKEAYGKELKIANSQGCSRLLEKLILMSSPSQLKSLWRKFTGHFSNLAQHRFASHCCEMLFRRSVGIASKEMEDDYVDDTVTDEFFASMESLFLYMLSELEPRLKHLCTDRFASHIVRGLLLLLSGQTVSSSDSVQSRKKENIALSSDIAPILESAEKIPVPQSFHDAVGKILAATAGSMSTEEIRSMAVHQIGGPTLQVLMQLEMGRSSKGGRTKAASKEGTLLGKLTGTSTEDEKSGESDSSSFFNNLLYDPVGSHLAEKIMAYAPKKEFKKLHKAFFKGRMGSLVRNETAGFVIQRILERLEKHKLEEALGEILPQVKGLIERSQVAVVKTLIDCCAKQDVEASGIAEVC
ncbi:ARM repeat-containing protein [Tuber magnatum]|uniref:Nucleolar protein 9 n=1 Tax=Tuber magnatum TaxID=42249 RepID=A0A317SB56_9PEZI|nr:ARM repeat-containing protein [Tuber magnatum]